MALIARDATHRIDVAAAFSLPRPGRRTVTLTLGLAFLFLLVDAMLQPRAFFDLWTLKTVQRLDLPGLHPVFTGVELLTGSEGAIVTWALALVLFLALRWWAPAIVTALLPLGGVLNLAVGELLAERSRPHLAELARTSANWEERSFPSGHVMGAVLLYGLLFVVARRIDVRPLRHALQSGSVLLIAAVGIERLWEGAHWPSDVLGAYTLGGLLLIPLVALYTRLDTAIGGLPLIHAAHIRHDETRPHAHALTSLVRFDGDRVAKSYAPGLLPRALYWLAFQAPFPYIRNRAALNAAMHRRNVVALLTEHWYGESRVARVLGVERNDDRFELVSERVIGQSPANRHVARAFLAGLAARFEEAGLPTWQIDPRQPRAIDNLLETSDGVYKIVDLESGLVSPLASLKTWRRAIRRGLAPFYDEVFFDVTRAYIARNEEAMRARFGDAWLEDLHATLDAAESETLAWRRGEPRFWNRLLTGIVTGFGIRTWRTRLQSRAAGGREKAQAWLDRAVAAWEAEERITADEAAALRAQMAEPTFQATLPYLGAHVLISIPLRFPFGSIVRPFLVLGALATATARLLTRRTDRETWRRAATIHSPLVMLLSAMPGVGSFAYLAAKPMRSNRLLLRTVADALLQKAPWNLYTRTGLRRLIARPTPFERLRAPKTAAIAGPTWELAGASLDHRTPYLVTDSPSNTTPPTPLLLPTPVALPCPSQPPAA
jgi:membrane-associated phospholipid phosphatase